MRSAGAQSMIFTGVALGLLVPVLAGEPKVDEVVDIAPVWSGHRVGFCLLTAKGRQFAAYYDAERHLTVAERKLNAKEWTFTRLPRKTGWDSHNYVTMTVDDDDFLHLSGDMHCVPLVYFRSTKPLDSTTLKRVPKMTGEREKRCTYPRFLRGPKNELIFTYRDGSSGNGDQIYNVYDHGTKTWRRLLDQPLTQGMGKKSVNAYLHGPVRGPDGYFHLCWVWRDHGGCETNHDLSYARSKDLVHWERSDGKPLVLPITLKTAEIVDPVPAKGGIINGNTKLGFDHKGRVVIGYHKYDAKGATQIYNARREEKGWKIYQISEWTHRWAFSGGGSIPFEVGLGAVQVEADGSLSQAYRNAKHGSGTWKLDPQTLRVIGKVKRAPRYPRQLGKPESSFPGMGVLWRGDAGSSGQKGVSYVLRWETLGSNRDRPRTGPLPKPSMLRAYRLLIE